MAEGALEMEPVSPQVEETLNSWNFTVNVESENNISRMFCMAV